MSSSTTSAAGVGRYLLFLVLFLLLVFLLDLLLIYFASRVYNGGVLFGTITLFLVGGLLVAYGLIGLVMATSFIYGLYNGSGKVVRRTVKTVATINLSFFVLGVVSNAFVARELPIFFSLMILTVISALTWAFWESVRAA